MLGDKHRMTAHGGLLPVAWWVCWGEALGDEGRSMTHDNIKAPAFQIESGLIVQMKA